MLNAIFEPIKHFKINKRIAVGLIPLLLRLLVNSSIQKKCFINHVVLKIVLGVRIRAEIMAFQEQLGLMTLKMTL